MNKKEFLLITICVFVSVIMWMFADIYHKTAEERIKNKTPIPEIKEYQIAEDVLEILEKKAE